MTVLEILTLSYVDYAVDVSFSKSEDIHSHLPNQPKEKTLASMLICSKFTCYLSWAITNWNMLQQSMHQIPG